MQLAPITPHVAAQQTNYVQTLLTWASQKFLALLSAGQPFPTPQLAPPSLGNITINTYNAVEPWVRWGFDLAAYAVGWIPYVGWLAPRIMIFYNFGERITRSIAYNVGYWLNGR